MNNRHGNHSFEQHTTTTTTTAAAMSPFDIAAPATAACQKTRFAKERPKFMCMCVSVYVCVCVCLAWCEIERMGVRERESQAGLKHKTIEHDTLISTYIHTLRQREDRESMNKATKFRLDCEWELFYQSYRFCCDGNHTHLCSPHIFTFSRMCVCVCAQCMRWLWLRLLLLILKLICESARNHVSFYFLACMQSQSIFMTSLSLYAQFIVK